MDNTETSEISAASWHWTDIVSTYRFWALVFAGFLVAWTGFATTAWVPRILSESGMNIHEMGLIFSLTSFGAIIGILSIVYFLRKRLRFALVLFAIITGLVSGILFYVDAQNPVLLALFSTLARLSGTAFSMVAIITLVAARPSIKTFIIVYSIVLIWSMVSQFIGPGLTGILYDTNPKYVWVTGLPAILGALLLLPAKSTMFAEAPNTVIAQRAPKRREPILVFLLCLIPFYALYWVFQRPAETKSLAQDIPQPSRGGALCLALFAGFILPVWFHDTRKAMGERLVNRSPALLGFLTFFLGPVGVAIAQSDNNLIIETTLTD